jgi:hypothetical protein
LHVLQPQGQLFSALEGLHHQSAAGKLSDHNRFFSTDFDVAF